MSDMVELRVLSGRHAGARVPVSGGESIGGGDLCDLVLTDMGMGEDIVAWLWLHAGLWRLSAEKPSAQELPAEGDSHALGSVAYLGDVALTVCQPESPWQQAQAQRAIAKASQPATAAEGAEADAVQTPQADAQDVVVRSPLKAAASAEPKVSAQATNSAGKRVPVWWFIALALLALLITVLWNVLRGAGPAPVPTALQQPAIDAKAQQQLVSEAQRLIQGVRPTPKLLVEPLADGRIRVAGWVANVAQLDQLAERLAVLRPLPQLAVRNAADLRDELLEAARTAGVRHAAFELGADGQLQMQGLVTDSAAREHALQAVRALMPKSLLVSDGLRMAATQGEALRLWLEKAGFPGARAEWRDGRMRLSLPLDPRERPRLENLLARSDNPLADLPFTLQVQELAVSESSRAVGAPVQRLIHVSAAPLPFKVRSVVGGGNPYVVIGDGTVLQVGGQRGGWRLESVEPDRLTFAGPRTLVLAR
ncbi:type III secretion system inner membrane ring subunit SctD [Diaphorobacter sp. HDW4B]|uniref:type III secretion system inner membrane ring subunit SctD n=1 Tax=Diaphorobacter sp. HDW4B TaxID=2714925 RepID=UPI00140B6735|nr:type III secretion system inner membrane ring subunit SctD [Diaphorobacter sp. HDW4B]QIL70539.1 type III secretion system inner membrane ring subunit SctD [Diaphorobacter sp. HDW4B]